MPSAHSSDLIVGAATGPPVSHPRVASVSFAAGDGHWVWVPAVPDDEVDFDTPNAR